jgi:hypothetical protein
MISLYISGLGLLTGGSQARKNNFLFGSSGIDMTFVTITIPQNLTFSLVNIFLGSMGDLTSGTGISKFHH